MKPRKWVVGLKDRFYGYQCPECGCYIINYKEKPDYCECGCKLDW